MKHLLILLALIAASTSWGQNYELKSTMWGYHMTADDVRITSSNAITLIPESKLYNHWQKGMKADTEARVYGWGGVALIFTGIPLSRSSNSQTKAVGYSSLFVGSIFAIIGLVQQPRAKGYYQDMLIEHAKATGR